MTSNSVFPRMILFCFLETWQWPPWNLLMIHSYVNIEGRGFLSHEEKVRVISRWQSVCGKPVILAELIARDAICSSLKLKKMNLFLPEHSAGWPPWCDGEEQSMNKVEICCSHSIDLKWLFITESGPQMLESWQHWNTYQMNTSAAKCWRKYSLLAKSKLRCLEGFKCPAVWSRLFKHLHISSVPLNRR